MLQDDAALDPVAHGGALQEIDAEIDRGAAPVVAANLDRANAECDIEKGREQPAVTETQAVALVRLHLEPEADRFGPVARVEHLHPADMRAKRVIEIERTPIALRAVHRHATRPIRRAATGSA